jgi:hypothetical protein
LSTLFLKGTSLKGWEFQKGNPGRRKKALPEEKLGRNRT